MAGSNGSPQRPQDFLAELQRIAPDKGESMAELGPAQPPPPPDGESGTYQDNTAAIVAIAQFANKAQTLVFEMDQELREARLQNQQLSKENSQQRLKIESLNAAMATRDATIG